MTTNSILLAVAEPQALVDITQALGAAWHVTSVASEEDALAQLDRRSFDALLVDFNLGSPDASELLNQAVAKHPEITRFLLAYEADLALVAAKVEGTPQILPKPAETASLKSRIESGVNDAKPKQNDSAQEEPPVESPAVSSIYAEVLKTLESAGVTAKQVGKVIAGDASLTSEVLRLSNSSYLGLPRNLTDPAEAVQSLGLETVKALVMALQFLAEHSHLKPGYLSFEQIWQHSVNVGQIARDLVLFETKDRKLAAQALTAGLLHDLGKVVLVTNFDDLYGRVYSLARKQPVTLWDVEKEMFGANHGEIGACLLGMWNLPSAIVDAAALHHEPPTGEQQQFTPLAAVHIANVLERELRPESDDLMVAPIINTTFLNELGLLLRLPVWRAAFANHLSVDLESEPESAETDESESTVVSSAPVSRTENLLPGPEAPTRTATSGVEESAPVTTPRFGRNRAYAGVAAGFLFLLAVWLWTRPELNRIEPAYARTPAPAQAPAAVAATPPTEPAPTVPSQAAPQVAATEQTPTAPAQTREKPAVAPPAPEPVPAPAPQPTTTNTPGPIAAAPEKPLPEFRLSAIIYSSALPSAIVNGQTVTVGDKVGEATVVSIKSTAVTLEINGKRKTYQLH